MEARPRKVLFYKLSNGRIKPADKKKWLKVIKFAVVSLATWLNPQAVLLLILLEVCFLILLALQKDEEQPKASKKDQSLFLLKLCLQILASLYQN
jgi:hypothetical protein